VTLSHDAYYFRQAVKQKCSVNRPYAFPGSPTGANVLKVAFVPASTVIRGIFFHIFGVKILQLCHRRGGICDYTAAL